jgi:dTDP-4-amino-4,6-dideoxy-D-glucose ammonia-lyase
MNYHNELNKYFKNNINSLFNDINLYDVKKDIDFIVDSFSKKPWIKQKEIFKNIKIGNKDYLKLINKFIRQDQQLQTKITKNSAAKKYWNTILPFSFRAQDVIKNEFKFPLRIAIFPGVSCMFYCGFCGRNQGAKYDSSIIDDGIAKINQMISETTPGTKISISGGLEPLTNPKLGNIIKKGSDLGFKLPLITNAYSLTDGYIKKNPEIWLLDSLRISLYGHDNDSYKSITQLDKSFKIVKKNIINFLNLRNQINKKLKVGFNYIILKENYKNLIDVIKLVLEINSEVKNGEGINFLTLRDDYQSVTGQDENLDKDRKYRITNSMNEEDRLKLLKEIEKFEDFRKRNCENLHIDYGYSLEYLSQKIPDIGLVKVKGNKIRPYGFSQLSVAIDLHGDIFLFREAGFLNRDGNKKVIIGRLGHEKNSLEKNIRKFLESKKPIIFDETDGRFLDSFDHVLNALVNQAEEDADFGIPIESGPIAFKNFDLKESVGNNWYSDDI